MDLYIAVGSKKVCMSLKDAGRPFNPVLPQASALWMPLTRNWDLLW
jgi:hypothetical protein